MAEEKNRMSAKIGIPLLAIAAVVAAIVGAATGVVFLIVFAVVGLVLAIVGAIWASRKVKKGVSGGSDSRGATDAGPPTDTTTTPRTPKSSNYR